MKYKTYKIFILTILILLCICIIFIITTLLLHNKTNYIYNTISTPPSDYQPIFSFVNGTPFDIQVATGGSWINKDGVSIPLSPGIGQLISANGGYMSFYVASWILFDVYGYDIYGNQLHLGQVTISLVWPYNDWPYLNPTNWQNGCEWKNNPNGFTDNTVFYCDSAGVDPDTIRNIQRLKCKNCDKKICSRSLSSFIFGNNTWYADYGEQQFNIDEDTLIQTPTKSGGRLFLGNGNGTIIPFSPSQGCSWPATGQWQIYIQLNHQNKTGWCETFYLAGRDTNNCSNGYLDGQDSKTTEIDIVETTWSGCLTHTCNILNWGTTGKIDHTICADGPSVPGTWFIAGARLTDTTVEIYHQLPGENIKIINKLTTPSGVKHTQPMVAYLGTWCTNKTCPSCDECVNNDSFVTKWKNFKYSSDTSGTLNIL